MARANVKKSNWTIIVNLVLLVLVIIWSIPIIGLFISSIRPQDNVLNTGWWTVFGEHTDAEFIRIFGFSSGKNTAKFAGLDYAKKQGLPIIPVWIGIRFITTKNRMNISTQ